ncbi:MAG: hypothetical protein M1830_004445 [Pleopsidium flavum]|nr:MAG: hypothetical protein M1830_004445 [Pleopsidium flavum]
MFSGGIFVIVAGLLRCILILTAGAEGPMKAGQWSCRESFIAVTVGNLPMIYALFQRTTRNIRLQSSFLAKSSGDDKNNNDNNSHPLGSHRTDFHKKGKKYPHPLSTPNDTAWGSDERIVLPPGTGTECRPVDADDAHRNGANTGGSEDSTTAGKGITVVTELSVESSKDSRGSVERREDDHKRLTTVKPSGFSFRSRPP